MSEIAVVIPCYRVRQQVLEVIAQIGPEVGWIFAVDDACPEGSGERLERECGDPRVQVLRHERNRGVGAATITGYRAALATPARVVVKLDGDGQMDPRLIPRLVRPILEGRADYVKGNRFHRIADLTAMPRLRLFGNAALSFLAKLSTGYWQIFDPNNGFTAIHRAVLAELPLNRIAERFFFESDMLYQLGQLRAVVCDMPMRAIYGDEPSSLRPLRTIVPFLAGHLRNTVRRLLYSYFLRGFSPASVELLLAPLLLFCGTLWGIAAWRESAASGVPATAGQVMLAALPIVLGVQLLLSWLHFDVAAEPRQPIHPLLAGAQQKDAGTSGA